MKIQLDKFYTNPSVCDYLINKLFSYFPSLKQSYFIEPSAGSGNFVNSLLKNGINTDKILALDIDPLENNEIKIKTANYILTKISYSYKNVIIGNPPFGKKSKLALEFLNKSLTESDFVAMIFPNSFKRFSMQKHIAKNAKLLLEIDVPKNAFLVNNKKYDVNSVFQIWATKNFKCYANDKRIKVKPSNTSEDFETFIHNNTQKTLRFFNQKEYQWDFALHRQGYYDYNKKITNPDFLKTNNQYVFVKIKNSIAIKIFDTIDFNKLSKANTITPGFSLTDLVEEYNKHKFYMLINTDIDTLYSNLTVAKFSSKGENDEK